MNAKLTEAAPLVPALLIIGTDTGVGKTVITAGLAAAAIEAGLIVAVMKPVQTGTAEAPGDLAEIARLVPGLAELPHELAGSYTFPLAASPHLAAEAAGERILPARLLDAVAAVRRRRDLELLLIEGVGGLMVPLCRDYLQADLIRALAIPVMLVARAGLGTINHTRLSLEALAAREIRTAGLVLNRMPPSPGTVEQDNLRYFRETLGLAIRAVVPDAATPAEAVAAMRRDPAIQTWLQQLAATTTAPSGS